MAFLDTLRNRFDQLVDGPIDSTLTPEENAQIARSGRLGMAASLLQAAAPRPVGTGNFFGDVGNALVTGQELRDRQALLLQSRADYRNRQALQQRQIQMQLEAAARKQQEQAALARYVNGMGIRGPQGDVANIAAQFGDTRDVIGVLSKILEQQKPEDLGPDAKKIRTIESEIHRPLTEREVFYATGLGEIYKPQQGDDLDKPLSATDLTRLRLPNGQQLPFGTTSRQAMEAGAKAYSEADLTRQSNISGALNTLGELRQMALGPDGVFRDNGGSVVTNNKLARLGLGMANGIGSFFGTEASMRRDVFNATSQGSISSLVRAMGEAGSLSDGDVKRALALIPTLGAVPETEQQAKAQFDELEKILRRGAANLQGSASANDPLGIL